MGWKRRGMRRRKWDGRGGESGGGNGMEEKGNEEEEMGWKRRGMRSNEEENVFHGKILRCILIPPAILFV